MPRMNELQVFKRSRKKSSLKAMVAVAPDQC